MLQQVAAGWCRPPAQTCRNPQQPKNKGVGVGGLIKRNNGSTVGFLVKFLLMFIVAILLVVFLLLVILLTMFQVVFDLLVDFSISLSKCIFFVAAMTEDRILQYSL
jgi:hypothetical protein